MRQRSRSKNLNSSYMAVEANNFYIFKYVVHTLKGDLPKVYRRKQWVWSTDMTCVSKIKSALLNIFIHVL